MLMLATSAVLIVAFAHLGFMVLEMFLWTRPVGLKIFRQTEAQARSSKTLAANQGLYNGFLAAGLAWGLVHPMAAIGREILTFFLVCVVIAGAYGAWTVNRRIFLVQAVPALIALALLFAL